MGGLHAFEQAGAPACRPQPLRTCQNPGAKCYTPRDAKAHPKQGWALLCKLEGIL